MEDYGDMDYVEYHLDFVRRRITQLRISKGVSEREMSLALGKGQSFINQIAAGKNAPLFENFFEICEYLGVTPQEFFDEGNACPVRLRELMDEAKRLDESALVHLLALMRELNAGR